MPRRPVPDTGQELQRPKRRYSFQCLNPACRRNQTRSIRRGRRVTCRHCGARNPGPARLAEVFVLGRQLRRADLLVISEEADT